MDSSTTTGRRVLVGAFAAATLTAVLALLLMDGSSARAVVGPGPEVSLALALQEAPDAEAIYFDQCAPCHGIVGQGGIGPPLTTSSLTEVERIELIRNGRDAMPAFQATLDEASIQALSSVLSRMAAIVVYEQQCAPCHGASGAGGIGPALLSETATFEDLRLIIAQGVGGMPAFAPTLTPDQLDGITAYIQQLAVLEVGSNLYSGLCTACHGVSGEGGAGPALAGSDFTAREISAAIAEGAGAMPGFASSLSVTELEAVNAYTRGLVGGIAVVEPPAGAGGDLYAQLCAACHGAEGEGGAGPSLQGGEFVDEELSVVIAEGVGAMPGFGSDLSAEDLAGLVQFVQASFGVPDTATGEEVYQELCAACHGADGEGGVGPALVGLGFDREEAASVINEGKGSMPGFAGQLDADGLEQLIVFLQTSFGQTDQTTTTTLLVPIRTGPQLYSQQCARCHLEDGSGDSGPDIRESELTLNEIISRIYGGHEGGMPAFEGNLTGIEVQAIARHVKSFRIPEGEQRGTPWVWPLVISSVAVIGVAGFLFARRPGRSDDDISDEESESPEA